MDADTCSVCGTPRILGQKSRWLPDGTIRVLQNPSLRMYFADCDELIRLFEELGAHLGVNGPFYLQEGARDFSRLYMGLFYRFLNQHLLDVRDDSRVLSILLDHLRIWGLGVAEPIELDEDEALRLCVRDAAGADLLCGYISGAAEIIWGRKAECSPRWNGDRLEINLISCDSSCGGPFDLEPEPDFGEVKGVIRYSFCPECGVPLQVSRLNWDLERGVITDLVTGRRLLLLGTEVISRGIERLTEEMGEHVHLRVAEAERDYAREVLYPLLRLSKDPQEMRALFGSMGHGDITAEGVERPTFRIRRPCQPHFMAGRVLGLYEGWRGERVAASWRISEWGTVYVTVHN